MAKAFCRYKMQDLIIKQRNRLEITIIRALLIEQLHHMSVGFHLTYIHKYIHT